jgi:copper chaperone CopZ
MPVRVELEVQGMTCDDCARHVERALRSVPGVLSARVPHWSSGKAEAIVEGEVPDSAMEEACRPRRLSGPGGPGGAPGGSRSPCGAMAGSIS